MKRHANIPVFIPHLGCPNQCVFCNQRTISGVQNFDPDDLTDIIENALSTIDADYEVEIAFFGGSFTGIDRELMVSLLKTARHYINIGRVDSIRCSTRPDYIDEEILAILKEYGVKTIELGLQSSNEEVLEKSKRGHSRDDEMRACRLIVEAGFDLIGQMMIGLPGSTIENELETARFIISVGAVGARIYPTVVFRDTELCHMAQSGEYTPLSLDDAVKRSARVFSELIGAGVRVIRVGLCASENLASDDTYYAGPNHSALGELVLNQIYYDKIFSEAKKLTLLNSDTLKVLVPVGELSKAVGQKKRNKLLLTDTLGIRDVRFYESSTLSDFEVITEAEKR